MWFLALPSLHPSTFLENVFHTCIHLIHGGISLATKYVHNSEYVVDLNICLIHLNPLPCRCVQFWIISGAITVVPLNSTLNVRFVLCVALLENMLPSFQLSTAIQSGVSEDDGVDSNNTLIIVITAVATCVATALAVGFICFVISCIHHNMYKKRMQKTVSFDNDYELKS